jgi:hypothetical protein
MQIPKSGTRARAPARARARERRCLAIRAVEQNHHWGESDSLFSAEAHHTEHEHDDEHEHDSLKFDHAADVSRSAGNEDLQSFLSLK